MVDKQGKKSTGVMLYCVDNEEGLLSNILTVGKNYLCFPYDDLHYKVFVRSGGVIWTTKLFKTRFQGYKILRCIVGCDLAKEYH